MRRIEPKARSLNPSELEAMSRQFDQPDYSPRFEKAPPAEKRRHNRAIRAAKRTRGRPTIGNGAQRIQITVERTLLNRADLLAQQEHISRSELIARGLRLALAS